MTTTRKPKRKTTVQKPRPKAAPKQGPAAVGAAILGMGALLGAAAVKLFRRKPTVGSVIGRPAMKRLKKLI